MEEPMPRFGRCGFCWELPHKVRADLHGQAGPRPTLWRSDLSGWMGLAPFPGLPHEEPFPLLPGRQAGCSQNSAE